MASYLVTGANRGIGHELVRQLAAIPPAQISHVFAVTRQPTPDVFNTLPGSERIFNIVVPSLTDTDAVAKGVEEVRAKLAGKGLDVLINNAGVMPWTKGGDPKATTKDLEVGDLLGTVEANVGTALVVTSAFIPLLQEGREKKVINITTTLGSVSRAAYYHPWATAHSYKISKAAMNMLSTQFALDLAEDGFAVVLVSPGWLKTDLGSQNADLDVDVGVQAVLDVVLRAGKGDNGKFLNVHVPGWEVTEGPNWYDGKEVPW